DSYEYTAFGEQYEHVGTDPQPYSFAGEPLDPNTGFQYHRARWMDPSAGRFAGMDPFVGSDDDPASLHRYLYATMDPVERVDPNGEESLSTTITALNVGLTVHSIAVTLLNPEITLGSALVSITVDVIPGGRLLKAAGQFRTIAKLFQVSNRLRGFAATFGRAATTKYRETFFRAFPGLQEVGVVVHHAVEKQVLKRYPHLATQLDEFALNSLENLRGIPAHVNPSVHLSAIRKRWNDFYKLKKNPTVRDLLDYARAIDDEFGHLFVPPLR
ncbi:MAG: RHS repeat-associated core domain-containing protein, partial [Vicinamibacteria bacterium]